MEYEEEEEDELIGSSTSFRVLRNSKDFDEVLQHAGLASRLASDRILNDDESSLTVDKKRFDAGSKVHKKENLRRLDSAERSQSFSGGVRTASAVRSMQMITLKMPKAPRDILFAFVFIMHILLVAILLSSFIFKLFSFKLKSKHMNNIHIFHDKNSSWIWTASIQSSCFVSVCIIGVFIYDPRDTRKNISDLAFPVALAALFILTILFVVGSAATYFKDTSEQIVVGSLFTFIIYISLVRTCYFLKRVDKNDTTPFFEAMLSLANRGLRSTTSKNFIVKLIFISLALHTVWLLFLGTAWAKLRAYQCTTRAMSRLLFILVLQCILLFHLYWFSNAMRCFLRAVISGSLLHFYLKLQKERISQLDDQFMQFPIHPPLHRHHEQIQQNSSLQVRDEDNHSRNQEHKIDDLLITNSSPELIEEPLHPIRYRRRQDTEVHEDVDHYIVTENNSTRPPSFSQPRQPQPHLKKRFMGLSPNKRPEYFFLRLFLGVSLGTIAKASLLGPLIRTLESIVLLFDTMQNKFYFLIHHRQNHNAKQIYHPILDLGRDLFLAHCAAFNKACSAASRDLCSLARDSGLDHLLDYDSVIPIIKSYRMSLAVLLAALWTTLTLLDRHLVNDIRFDCEDKDAFFAHFILAYLSLALATEPLVATIEVAYLAFVQIPLGLMQADPIIYQRFQRLLLRRSGRHQNTVFRRTNHRNDQESWFELQREIDSQHVDDFNYDEDDDDNVGLLSAPGARESSTHEVHL